MVVSADFQVFFSSVHQRAMMAYVIRRNLVVFRAGTANEPLFTSSYIEDNSKEHYPPPPRSNGTEGTSIELSS